MATVNQRCHERIDQAASIFTGVGLPVANVSFDYNQRFELFDFNTIYLGPRIFQLLITRIDSSSGWEKHLGVKMNGAQEINVGTHDGNKKIIEVQTDFDLVPKRQNYDQKIPKKIFQTCHTKRLCDPLMQNSIQSIVLKNPEYEHILYTDEQCAAFLTDNFPPDVIRAWNNLQVGAYKADLWRYCMLFKHGGVYIDCKMIEHFSLSEVISPIADLILVKDVIGSSLYQAFLACVPGHPLMEAAINRTVQNVISKNYGRDAMSISGPSLLGLLYNQQRGMPTDSIIAESDEIFANVKPADALRRKAIGNDCRALYEKIEWRWTFVVKGNRALFSKCFPGYYDGCKPRHYTTLWKKRKVFKETQAFVDHNMPPTIDNTSTESHSKQLSETRHRIITTLYDFWRVGYDHRHMTFLSNGMVGQGMAGCEIFWNLKEVAGCKIILEISSYKRITCLLTEGVDNIWRGRWLHHEKMPIELAPIGKTEVNSDSNMISKERNSKNIDFAVTTVSRPIEYIHQQIASLSTDLPLRLIVGTVDCSYLDKYQNNRFLEIVAAPLQEWNLFKDRIVHHRASWNYWRTLTLGSKSSTSKGLVALEDDVVPAYGWEMRLYETIDQIESEHKGSYALALYSAVSLPRPPHKQIFYVPYLIDKYYGAQAMYYPDSTRVKYADYLKRNGVDSFSIPHDILFKEFLNKAGIPLLAAVPSLFQHIGEVSTGLGRFHRAKQFQSCL